MKPITVNLLRKFYHKYKIKYKQIITRRCWQRKHPEVKAVKDDEMLEELKWGVLHAGASADEIISIDESVFHQRLVVKKAWSTLHDNVRPKSIKNSEPAIAVVGAMSKESGWIHHMQIYKALKGRDFLRFLQELRDKVDGKCALLLDNASIHKTKYVKDWCEAYNFIMLWLPPTVHSFNRLSSLDP